MACDPITYIFFSLLYQRFFDNFEKEAGLGINWNKTKAFFSKNTPNEIIRNTCKDLNIKAGNIGERYLGLPLIIQKITKETFYNIINKIQSKISTWYNKYLSFAGRCTLINHVVNTIPNYTMTTHKIPSITINKINSINKFFCGTPLIIHIGKVQSIGILLVPLRIKVVLDLEIFLFLTKPIY